MQWKMAYLGILPVVESRSSQPLEIHTLSHPFVPSMILQKRQSLRSRLTISHRREYAFGSAPCVHT